MNSGLRPSLSAIFFHSVANWPVSTIRTRSPGDSVLTSAAFPRAGAGRGVDDDRIGGLEDRLDAFQGPLGELGEFGSTMIDHRGVHRPQDAVRQQAMGPEFGGNGARDCARNSGPSLKSSGWKGVSGGDIQRIERSGQVPKSLSVNRRLPGNTEPVYDPGPAVHVLRHSGGQFPRCSGFCHISHGWFDPAPIAALAVLRLRRREPAVSRSGRESLSVAAWSTANCPTAPMITVAARQAQWSAVAPLCCRTSVARP